MKVEGLKIHGAAIGEFLKSGATSSLISQKANEAASIAAGIYSDSKGLTSYEVLGPEVNTSARRIRAAVIIRSPSYQQRTQGRNAIAQAGEAVSDDFVRRSI